MGSNELLRQPLQVDELNTALSEPNTQHVLIENRQDLGLELVDFFNSAMPGHALDGVATQPLSDPVSIVGADRSLLPEQPIGIEKPIGLFQ